MAMENKDISFRDLEVSREITLDEEDSWHGYQRFLQNDAPVCAFAVSVIFG